MNQLSIHGAVSNGCEEFGPRPHENERTLKKFAKENFVNKEALICVNSQEVNSLVCAPRTQPASGNRWRESLHNFELQSKTSQLEKVCELASFWRTVETGFVLQDHSGHGRWFWRYSIMLRISILRADKQSQSVCSNSRRNINWTSHRSSRRTTSL